MVRWLRLLIVVLLAAAGPAALSGCLGGAHDTSYFPYFLPFGDIVRTHARPPGHGYFADFDPHACRIECVPLEATNPVHTQHLLVATVFDDEGKPRRNRRVEWMLEGVGNIVEVDESGYLASRGYKVDNKYAVSYTDWKEHRISRRPGDPNADFVIEPGQTWCVITSAVEGDTHVTVYAPEIASWDAHKVFVTKHWVDAEWAFPPPAVNKFGTNHVFTTKIFRHSDHQPLANYRVRYKILDGPPAVFLPGRTQEEVAVSDLDGNAHVTLAQVAPAPGINRVAVEIIRPPDPTSPGGVGMVIARHITTKTWQAPHVVLSKTAPPAVGVGQDIPYTLTVTNNGLAETKSLTVRDFLPDNAAYVRSDPPAQAEGNQLIWTLGELPPGQSRSVQVVLKPQRVGPVVNRAAVTTDEGQTDERQVTTEVTQPGLKLAKTGPQTATLGMPITYQLTVTNTGTGPATNVLLKDDFDPGLEHESKANPVELQVGLLAAGASKTVNLVLTPRKTGTLVNRAVATADGGLSDRAQHSVVVQEARLTIKKTGPQKRYVGRPAVWDITVANPGETPLSNVVVRDLLPPELAFESATQGGQLSGGQVVWSLGPLGPREQKTVQVQTKCVKMSPRAVNVATASADPGQRDQPVSAGGAPGLQVQDEAAVEIHGLPAFRMEVVDLQDPIDVGGKTTYKIDVTNQGTLAGNEVRIVANVPPEMRPLKATGPSAYKIEGQRVTFEPVNALQPGQALTYTVEVEALRPGTAIFEVELKSATLSGAVKEQEPTTIKQSGQRQQAPAGPAPVSIEPPRLSPQPAGSPAPPPPAPPSPGPPGLDSPPPLPPRPDKPPLPT